MGALSGAFCALTVAIVNNGNCIRNRPGDDSDAAGLVHGLEPGLLLGSDPSGGDLDLDAGEDGQAGADHGLGDGDGAPADQVSGSTGKAEGDEPTGAGIWEAAAVVSVEPQVWPGAHGKSDLLLKVGFTGRHSSPLGACAQSCATRQGFHSIQST